MSKALRVRLIRGMTLVLAALQCRGHDRFAAHVCLDQQHRLLPLQPVW